jgi:hypothetical protein
MHCRRATRPLLHESISNGSRHGGGGQERSLASPLTSLCSQHVNGTRAGPISWPASPKALRRDRVPRRSLSRRGCDQLQILGNPVVTMDEAALLLTAEEHYPYGLLTMIVSLEAIVEAAPDRRGRGGGIPQHRPRQPPAAAQRRPANGPTAAFSSRPCVVLIRASASMSTGPVWKGVVAVADDLDASVVVVGSRGLSGAREVLDRRLSHDLARRAGRQLPIVPPAARCG